MTVQSVDQEIHGLERAVHTLTREFPGVPASEIRTLVAEMRGDFAGRPIREFVPLFVERKVRQLLKDRHADDSVRLARAVPTSPHRAAGTADDHRR